MRHSRRCSLGTGLTCHRPALPPTWFPHCLQATGQPVSIQPGFLVHSPIRAQVAQYLRQVWVGSLNLQVCVAALRLDPRLLGGGGHGLHLAAGGLWVAAALVQGVQLPGQTSETGCAALVARSCLPHAHCQMFENYQMPP